MNQRSRSTPAAEPRLSAATPFDDLGVAVSCLEPLAHHTWLGIGGAAEFFCEPVDVEALARVVKRCHEKNIPLRVIGGGSNVLVPGAGFAGMVVRLSAPSFCGIHVESPVIRVGAGAKLVLPLAVTRHAGHQDDLFVGEGDDGGTAGQDKCQEQFHDLEKCLPAGRCRKPDSS